MRSRLLLLTGVLLLVGAAIAGAATKEPRGPELLPPDEGHKIWICHATGNGFVRIHVDIDSIVRESGHGKHAGNIIPAFEYRLTPNEEPRSYPGRNWPEGEAIWENGCSRPPLPGERIEVFACVEVHNGTFSATFGYNSGSRVSIPVGDSNRFSPRPLNRGQVTEFGEGYKLDAFTVKDIEGEKLTWTVKSGEHSASVTASRESLRCTTPEPENGNGPPVEPENGNGSTDEPLPTVPVGVFVACVSNHGSSFDAVFGYENRNLGPVTVPVGAANRFSPGPADRGQPTTFGHGHVAEAFKVTGIPDSVELKWTLAFTDTRMAIASADFGTKCAAPPAPAPRPIGIFATCATRHGSTYDATFGYVNENAHPMTIPIGARNSISPGPAGQGQPETFAPGFVDAAFAVRRIPVARSVTWKVGQGEEARVAVATANLPSCLSVPPGPAADAWLRKSAAPRRAVVGQLVKFTILLRNDSSDTLSPAGVRDVLRGNRVRVLAATASRGSCRVDAAPGGHAVRCRAPALVPGGSLAVRVTAKAVAAGTARDRATILGLSDPTPRNDVATAAVQIRPPTPSNGLG